MKSQWRNVLPIRMPSSELERTVRRHALIGIIGKPDLSAILNGDFLKHLNLTFSAFWAMYNNILQPVLRAPTLCLGFQSEEAFSAAVVLLEFWKRAIATIGKRKIGPISASAARWALVPAGMALGQASACQFHQQPLQHMRASVLAQMQNCPGAGTIEALKLFWEWPDNPDRLRDVWSCFFNEVHTRNMIAWDIVP